jgi:DNA-binding transcriptional regulator LsrR (DeoR family)
MEECDIVASRVAVEGLRGRGGMASDMARADDLRLLTTVARLYYLQGLRQPQIATQLDLSQATVSRLLKRAHEEGIVRTTVGVPSGIFPELEEALQAIYGIKRAIVVDTLEDDAQIRRDLGAAAAHYLETTLKDGEIVGISSWSSTLLAMVEALHPLSAAVRAKVVQILGGVGNPAAEVHANSLTQRLARLLHGDAIYLSAPGVAGSAESKKVLLTDPFVWSTLDLFKDVTLALVGIGALEPSRLLASSGNIFAPEELALLRDRGAVGDICLRVFDRAGIPVVTPLDDRVVSMSLKELQKVRRAVGIAGGSRKYAAIRAALTGHWINVLITDRFTAERLADEDRTK